MRFLDLLLALGPIFSVSRLLGKERVRRAEVWILNQLGQSVRLIPLFFVLGLEIFFLYVVLIVYELIRIAIVSTWEATAGDSFGCILLSAPIIWFLAFKALGWMLRRIHSMLHYFCLDWKQSADTAPPWPLSLFEDETFRRSDVFQFLNLMPVLFSFYLIAPFILLGLSLLVLPLWAAEQVRRRLTPENPLYSDLVAYFISVAAMITKFANHL
jgi:hypothetical protein